MKRFLPRDTPTQNLAWIGISVALVTAFALLSTFVPVSSFFVVLFLPVLTALTAYYLKPSYLILYFFAGTIVVTAATCYQLTSTLFFILPTFFSGILFGFCLRKNLPSVWLIFATSCLSLALNALSIPLLRAIYGIDVIDVVIAFLPWEKEETLRNLLPAFLMVEGLIESGISFFLILGIMGRWEEKEEKGGMISTWFGMIFAVGCAALSFGIAFVSPLWAYLIAIWAIYFALTGMRTLFSRNPWGVYLTLGVLILLSFYLSAYFYSALPKAIAPLLFLSFFASLSLSEVVSVLSLKHQERKPQS